MHERKLVQTHEELFHIIHEQVPSLRRLSNIPMVTDGEKAIITAVRNKLPNINLMRCWNHIIGDIQSWLKQHGEKATDLSFYCDDVRQLFQATSETEYNKLLTKVKWDNLF